MPIKKTLINAASRAGKAFSGQNATVDKAAKAADVTSKTVAVVGLWKVWLIVAIIVVVAVIVGSVTSIISSTAANLNSTISECSAGIDSNEFTDAIEASGQELTEEEKDAFSDPSLAGNCGKQGSGFNGYAYPPTRGYMSAPFNQYRSDPPRYHQGMDIAAQCEEPIYAFAGGEVIKVVLGSEQKSGDEFIYPMGEIVIQHTEEFKTRYLHMAGSSTTVKVGDIVDAGQQIATQWSNGPSTGCHLHIEAYENNVAVDMKTYLDACGFEYSSTPGDWFDDFPEEPIPCGNLTEDAEGSAAGGIKGYAKQQIQTIAKVSASDLDKEFKCLDNLWNRESNWRATAINPAFSPSQPNQPEYQAYGIPQGAPGSKMASEGDDWKTNPKTQVRWGLKYIAGRYGTPCGAWAHSEAHNWY